VGDIAPRASEEGVVSLGSREDIPSPQTPDRVVALRAAEIIDPLAADENVVVVGPRVDLEAREGVPPGAARGSGADVQIDGTKRPW
jgi:hypothetical protein